jgi:hypothetical protein
MVSLVPWVCRYQKKSLMPTAYCLTTSLLLSNSNHKHLKVCYLYDFVCSLGMSFSKEITTDYCLLTND